MKVIFITGCSSGIGLATAKLFGERGWRVYAGVINPDEKKELEAKELMNVVPMVCDVSHEMQVRSTVREIVRKDGMINVLVNNAGKMYLGAIEDFEIEKVREQLEVNFLGVLRVTQEVLPNMRERKDGLVINVSSINGLVSFPLYGIYSASKFAMETVTEVLRTEVAPWNVKTVLVEPGTFRTNFWDSKFVQMKHGSAYEGFTKRFLGKLEKHNQRIGKQPFKRWFKPEKVAELIWKVANEEKPKLRYRIGIDAQLYYWGRKLLPFGVWQGLLRKVYGW